MVYYSALKRPFRDKPILLSTYSFNDLEAYGSLSAHDSMPQFLTLFSFWLSNLPRLLSEISEHGCIYPWDRAEEQKNLTSLHSNTGKLRVGKINLTYGRLMRWDRCPPREELYNQHICHSLQAHLSRHYTSTSAILLQYRQETINRDSETIKALSTHNTLSLLPKPQAATDLTSLYKQGHRLRHNPMHLNYRSRISMAAGSYV